MTLDYENGRFLPFFHFKLPLTSTRSLVRAQYRPPFENNHLQYFDFAFGNNILGWSATEGIFAEEGVSHLIGYVQYDNADVNANTNAFIYALAGNGFIGYGVVIILVVGLLWLLDNLYFGSGNVAFMYLGFSFSLLVAEQAATTVFISSGVGFLLALLVFTGDGQRTYKARSLG